jgi:hypothetical protein
MRFSASPEPAGQGKVLFMTRRTSWRKFSIRSRVGGLAILLALVWAPCNGLGEAPAAAVSAFDKYVSGVEARLAQQHRSQKGFLAPVAGSEAEKRLRQGELIVERLTPSTGADMPGAMLHHWRGTAFAAGATVADFERLMRDFGAYPRYFSPQVVQARVLSQHGDRFQTVMRVRQRHVITVVMDTSYDVSFGGLDMATASRAVRRSLKSIRLEQIGSERSAPKRSMVFSGR